MCDITLQKYKWNYSGKPQSGSSLLKISKEAEIRNKEYKTQQCNCVTDIKIKMICNRETTLEGSEKTITKNENTLEMLQSLSTNSPLRKHAYSNIYKISPPKTENFQIKNSDIFHTSGQNIDWGYSLELPRRGGSNEYPQSMFLIRNKKNNVYPCKPQFYYIKVGFEGLKII